MSAISPVALKVERRQAAPVRILHVVGGMQRGGIETWLMHVLRRVDRNRFQMDFLSHTREACAFDAEIKGLGCKVIRGPDPHRPWQYRRELNLILKEHGPYDVLHSHVHHFNGYVLKLAKAAGIPRRFAHSHNDTKECDKGAGVPRRLYLTTMQKWINRYATRCIGASGVAGAALFGDSWRSDARARTLFYSIDLRPFHFPLDAQAVRSELDIAPDAFVIGHAGRFVAQKNHAFLLNIFAEVARREPAAVLLLLGTGPLREPIARQALEMGIAERVIFGGVRSDVPRLMRGAMDIFLLPSLHEGLPVVLLEAQAAGRPSVISDVIATESDAVKPLIHRLSLTDSPDAWARTILRLRSSQPVRPGDALAQMSATSFNVENSIRELEELYSG